MRRFSGRIILGLKKLVLKLRILRITRNVLFHGRKIF